MDSFDSWDSPLSPDHERNSSSEPLSTALEGSPPHLDTLHAYAWAPSSTTFPPYVPSSSSFFAPATSTPYDPSSPIYKPASPLYSPITSMDESSTSLNQYTPSPSSPFHVLPSSPVYSPPTPPPFQPSTSSLFSPSTSAASQLSSAAPSEILPVYEPNSPKVALRSEPLPVNSRVIAQSATTESVRAMLGDLHLSPKYTDLRIKVGGKQFHVLRAVVCSKSRVLDAQCSGPWREASERVIEVVEHGAEAVECMIQFMYNGDYTILAGDKQPSCADLFLHARVYAIAEYYHVRDLKFLAVDKFMAALPDPLDKSPHYVDVVKEVYASTPETDTLLRSLAVQCLAQRAKHYVDQIDVTGGDIDDLANDFIRELVKQSDLSVSASQQVAANAIGENAMLIIQARHKEEDHVAALKKMEEKHIVALKKKEEDHLVDKARITIEYNKLRKKWLDELRELQTSLLQSNEENATLTAAYTEVQEQFLELGGEHAQLQSDHKLLQGEKSKMTADFELLATDYCEVERRYYEVVSQKKKLEANYKLLGSTLIKG